MIEVIKRIDVVDFATGKDRVEHGGILSSIVRTSKEVVFTA
jgi:hypothetical protein